MRKKLLLEQIEALTYSYRQSTQKVNELKKENEELLLKINELEEKLASNNVNDEISDNEPLEEVLVEVEKTETQETAKLDKSMEYGAQIIGKIIIESAKYTEKITASKNENTKDLVNLIMGKSEICKAEILNIAISDADVSVKCDMMDNQYNEAIEYFKSVEAQI